MLRPDIYYCLVEARGLILLGKAKCLALLEGARGSVLLAEAEQRFTTVGGRFNAAINGLSFCQRLDV